MPEYISYAAPYIRSKNFIYDPAKIAFAPVPLQFNDSSDMSIESSFLTYI